MQGVWLFPEHFKHLVANTPLCRVSGGEPVDAVVFLFYVSKVIPPLPSPLRLPTRVGILERTLQVFQFGAFLGFYFSLGPLPGFREIR